MEATQNPYQTPSGQLAMDDQQFGEVRFFSPSSRIGRLRYLAHGLLLVVGLYIVLVLIMTALVLTVLDGTNSNSIFVSASVGAAFWIFFLVISFFLAIQRLHDLNQTGWLSLLLIVPVVGFFFWLYLVFAPGTQGTNNYGFQPPPNKVWHWIIGLIGPILGILAVVGIIAVSIPAYQDYVKRAGESSQSQEYYYDYDDEEDDE